MRKIVYLFFMLWSSILFGQTQHVLFIGNSFTMNYEMPKKLSQIAKNEGESIFTDQLTKGGMDWQYHATNPNTYEKIKSEPWDYVVLQGKSYEPLYDSLTVENTTKKYGRQIIDSVRQHWPNAKIMLFMTWGYANGIDLDKNQGHLNYDQMQNRLKSQYISFADEFKVAVAPIGEIWQQLKLETPSINLYDVDNYHQNKTGSFLIASSFFNMIFNETVAHFENLPYPIDENTSRLIADKTREVIFNPKYDWRTNYWESFEEEAFTYFDFKFKNKTLILKADIPENYKVKWKLNGKKIATNKKISIPIEGKDELQLRLVIRKGFLRGRETEEAVFKGGKRLIPLD